MGFVRKVGRAIDDAIIQPVVHTVEKVVENPVLLAGLAFGVPALGGLLGAGGAAAAAGEIAASELLASELGADIAGGLLSSGAGEMAASELLASELGADVAGGLLGGSEMAGSELLASELGSDVANGLISSGEMSSSELLARELSQDVANGLITAEQATAASAAAANAAASGSAFPLSVSDALRLAGIATTVAGAGKLANSLGSSGSGGFDIVPVPSNWTSPPPTSVAEFTPLAPIDFGNKQMLQGTQWEKLLSPTYNAAPLMPNPAVSTNPSNMSFDQLMGVLGNTRTSVPTQNVSINDVIAGIQSQYGQTPQGSMGQKPA